VSAFILDGSGGDEPVACGCSARRAPLLEDVGFVAAGLRLASHGLVLDPFPGVPCGGQDQVSAITKFPHFCGSAIR